jgi:hypothetical protein
MPHGPQVCVPQLPHGWVAAGVHSGVPEHEHAPQVQLALHVCVPSVSHVSVAPGAQAPCPVHWPHWPHEPQVCIPIPQLPHAWVAPDVQMGGAVQVPPPSGAALQCPFEHDPASPQYVPQPPQLSGSLDVSAQ